MKRSIKNTNGEGSIYFERSRNKYCAALLDPMGKRVAKRFSTKQEAEEWLTVTRASIFKNTYIVTSNSTLGEWMLEYLEIYKKPRVRIKTLDDYVHSAKLMEPILDIPLKSLSTTAVQRFYNQLNIAAATKVKVHRLLKAAISKAHALDMITKNVMLAVDPPKQEHKEIEVFTTEELNKILAAFYQGDFRLRRHYPFFFLAIMTGARIGELMALKINNVCNGYIDIKSSLVDIKGKSVESLPKTKAGIRRITIDPATEKLLREHIKKQRIISIKGYVFQTENNTPYTQKNITRVWRKVQQIAGVPYRNFHAIRHTHATQLIANNVPITEVAKRLGHSRISHTLNLYAHAMPNFDTTIPEKFINILKAGS